MQANINSIVDKSGDRPGYVYLLKDNSINEYKIGRSKNLKHRLSTLLTANPHLQLLDHVIWEDNVYLERYLHKRFETYRVGKSEYFKLNEKDVNWTKALFTSLEQLFRKLNAPA